MKQFRNKLNVTVLALVVALLTVAPLLTSCAGQIDVDTSGMYLVVYDGNGGYLGNKASQVRKLFCSPDSKIPDYPVDYATSQYTVPSLGLAMREGYNLLGWYASDAAEYKLSENGEYVYLSVDEGNGIFELNQGGEYVLKYENNPKGEFVFVYVEESADENDTYVYINSVIHADNDEDESAADPAETDEPAVDPDETEEAGEPADGGEDEGTEETGDVDETSAEDGDDEEEDEKEDDVITLSVQSGFYVCNGEETINDIDDENLREAYRAAYESKTYTSDALASIAGWQRYDDLGKAYRELFADLDRYAYSYTLAEEGDEELDHYSVESGYASLYSIFVENEKGDYVYIGSNFEEYDENDDAHASAQRYAMSERYVFTQSGAKKNASYLDRFDATMDYWDFTEDKVTEDVCTWDGEKYVLTLNAHWVKKNTVYYHYENALGQVDESWTRLLEDNITYVPIRPGEVIGKKEIVPLDAGRTFVCWTKTKGEYDPWDFANDVFPVGETELHLYGYYVEGTYTRIVSAAGLSKVGNDPAGKYILINDIDLGGKEITSSPLGLKDTTPFTGEFISLGKTISGVNFKVSPSKQQTIDSSVVSTFALFPTVSGAKISGVNVEASATFSGIKATGAIPATKRDINLVCSALVGKAIDAVTEIEDCNATLTCAVKSEDALESEAYRYVIKLSGICADGSRYAKTAACTGTLTQELSGSVRVIEN